MPAPSRLEAVCKEYLTELRAIGSRANATDELSYRDALGRLLRESAVALGRTAEFTGEAKALAVGRPDYAVTEGLKEIGFVEAESVSADLNHLRGHALAQNTRFKQNLHALLLTNHLEFQLWVENGLVETARFAPPPAHGNIHVGAKDVEEWERLLSRFLSENVPAARNAEDVARQLAKRAKELRFAADVLVSHENSVLHAFWNAYKETLYPGMPAEQFADVYAQTFTYGLFLAWYGHDKGAFDRAHALAEIPDTVPPIAALLEFGGGKRLPAEFLWIVDGLCSDLAHADKAAVLKPYTDGRDPIMHFYETFLAAYDPRLRESRGVYYTPDSVVEFIVRAVDDLLQSDFGKAEGLADPAVRLLDPAAGTATFLAHAYTHVRDAMTRSGAAGQWPARAETHVARHFFGFELLPAAYTLAHIKLRALLLELNAPLPDSLRLPIYLTNTLDEGIPHGARLPFTETLIEEAELAAHVKNDEPILVVLGNPPYSGHSSNPSRNEKGEKTHIGALLEPYFSSDGVKLNERNSKWLQDDYVKFLRFAEDRIERTGQGIVAFITNHGYLDNPTFRGMRRHLMTTFDRLYFYDLHGNSLKKERAPDGGNDENVFDIQQGVAICVLVKLADGKAGKADPIIKHMDLFGSRSQKYAALLTRRISDNNQVPLTPTAPAYLFVPQNQDVREEYEQGWSVKDVFPINASTVTTARNDFSMAYMPEELIKRVNDLRGDASDAEIRSRYNLKDVSYWNLADARTELRRIADVGKFVQPYCYRPLDFRYVYYHTAVCERLRPEVMKQMHGGNVALLTHRPQSPKDFTHVYCTNMIGDQCVAANKSEGGGNSFQFPLYIYPTSEEERFGIEKHANFASGFVAALTERLEYAATPEDTFHYLYAILHSPEYRTRYAEFLKRDFPRIPLPPDADTFALGAGVGKNLVAAHLLEDPTLLFHAPGFPHAGTNVVDKMKPEMRYRDGRIWLNAKQYFDGVAPDVWNFRVGGYQPAAKWLNDRAERTLADADLTHYRKLLAAQSATLALLPDADAMFAHVLAAM